MGKKALIDFDTQIMTIFREEEVDKIHLNEFVREIKATQIVDTPVMPTKSISYSQNGSVKIFFVQRPESLVPVQYRHRVYQIAWPWQVYGIIVDNLTPLEVVMFFAKKEVEHEFDEVCWSCLPNQNEGTARLCMGSGLASEVSGAATYADVIKKVIYWIRTASFNNDLTGHRQWTPQEILDASPDGTPIENNDTLFAAWEAWTQNAGEDWRNVNRLSWSTRGHFDEVRRGFRS